MKMVTKNQALRILLAVIVVLGALALASCNRDDNQVLRIDNPAPDFTLKDYNGKEISLKSYKGKQVLLHFWDTTFTACIEEMPYFQELHEEWSKTGEIVLITIDIEDDASAVKAFMEKENYTFPVLLDNDYNIADKYKVQYVPTTFFIDKEGILKMNVVGPFKDKAAIEKQISSFLASN